MEHLVENYFANFNIYMPILHRKLFETNIRDGLHLVDEGFGAIVLLTCALGAKFSNDPRVRLEDFDDPHSAGWKWFRPVQVSRKAIRLQRPRLYDLQIACVSVPLLNM